MNYPPKHHQDYDKNHMIDVIKTYPLATVISVQNNDPFVTHLPLIYREEDGKLIGHIDIYNPQANLLKDNNPITILFSGPQCYISPSVYTTTQLPTWNYIKVHLKGTVKAIESKDALKQSLITMTEFLEQPDHKYVLEPDNPRMEGALDYIKMFEITINDWEGKFKLSQDKHPKDIRQARAELVRANQESIKEFLDRVF
ncbi:protease synthase and sporulation protein PAI 2 [Aquaticitalea lipolytica]|jgi:transcriptional regulator|uniref:Protease synthase and sporulation protein PAI 2 n=1 Tax=Aquaticitalea lipolytica TaxID=1247562 RepID=A0A8J2TSZ6_9FLAO|nr:FMN-binding negative transcriptional regulator [Aquaticitalea lipolytica]GFZ92074.1 protease synthase and sporulation protein PAI 2 [Aquaticitalea lipolytica]